VARPPPGAGQGPGKQAEEVMDVAVGRALLPQLVAAGVTAVFCFNDLVAVGALLACQERGIAVPGDLSLVGFDDIDLARYMTPPLTTVQQPRVRLGNLATQLVLDLLAGRPVQNHVLPPKLIERASTTAWVPR
jgi:LacI family transcriptional regulator/LacI family repressor for deo operon, udp, cdd, tsx, nupC, and nupG